MPFPTQTARAFTRANVEALNPSQYGCYGLFRDRGPRIYIGKGDIRQRLLDHLNGDNPRITRENPTHWYDEVTSNADAREKQLIVELNPICNRKVG